MSTIRIPVSSPYGDGYVEINLGSDGRRVIKIDVPKTSMTLVQNGLIRVTHSVMGTMSGTLYKVFERRRVSGGKWAVRDFVITMESDKGLQKRMLQACGGAIEELEKIPIGANVAAEVKFMGNEFVKKVGGGTSFYNLDTVVELHTQPHEH